MLSLSPPRYCWRETRNVWAQNRWRSPGAASLFGWLAGRSVKSTYYGRQDVSTDCRHTRRPARRTSTILCADVAKESGDPSSSSDPLHGAAAWLLVWLSVKRGDLARTWSNYFPLVSLWTMKAWQKATSYYHSLLSYFSGILTDWLTDRLTSSKAAAGPLASWKEYQEEKSSLGRGI